MNGDRDWLTWRLLSVVAAALFIYTWFLPRHDLSKKIDSWVIEGNRTVPDWENGSRIDKYEKGGWLTIRGHITVMAWTRSSNSSPSKLYAESRYLAVRTACQNASMLRVMEKGGRYEMIYYRADRRDSYTVKVRSSDCRQNFPPPLSF